MVPRPFLVGGVRKGRGRKALVNNSTPTRIHGISLMFNNSPDPSLPAFAPPTRKGLETKLGNRIIWGSTFMYSFIVFKSYQLCTISKAWKCNLHAILKQKPYIKLDYKYAKEHPAFLLECFYDDQKDSYSIAGNYHWCKISRKCVQTSEGIFAVFIFAHS